MKNTPNHLERQLSLQLVYPRMLRAVREFLVERGKWPTHMLVPAENLQGSIEAGFPLEGSPYDEVSCVLAAVKLIPVTLQEYLCIGISADSGDASVSASEARGYPLVPVPVIHNGQHQTPVLRRPIPDSYVVPGSALAAGAYPGSPPSTSTATAMTKLESFLDAGISAFIDLTGPADRLSEYAASARELAAKRGMHVTHERFHIPDMGVCDAQQMNTILDAIDLAIASGRGVYVHCWGGVGRTGTVIGCWLVRHGKSGAQALEEVQTLFRSMSAEKWERHKRTGSPQTADQRAVVREWAANDSKLRLSAGRASAMSTDAHSQKTVDPRKENMRFATTMAMQAVLKRRNTEESSGNAFTLDTPGATWTCSMSYNDISNRFRVEIVEASPTRQHRDVDELLRQTAATNRSLQHGHFIYDVDRGAVRYVTSIVPHSYVSPNDIEMLIEQAFSEVAPNDDDELDSMEDDIDLAELLNDLKQMLDGTDNSEDEHWKMLRPREDIHPSVRDRMRGGLIGLAVGDAVGTTVEFMSPGSFPPVTDMVGGGPFRLKAGDWTDDTSMALCLAESLIERRDFDAEDQMNRYLRWWREGHLSSTGTCFDIGNTVSRALRTFEKTSDPFSGSTDEQTAGNGSLMRLAPIPIYFFGQRGDAIARAADSSRTTHAAPVAVDACRYLAALMIGALEGVSKDELLSSMYTPIDGYWDGAPLHPIIEAIASGSFKQKSPPAIRGTGYAADALEAALWAFHSTSDFREGCLLATNLGDDADTTAAIYGQLAGAFYGESGIPIEWRQRLTKKPLIDRFAEQLFQLSFSESPLRGARLKQARTHAEQLLASTGGDAAEAIRKLVDSEKDAKKEMGVMAYAMNGPMHTHAVTDETLLQLRIELGLSPVRGTELEPGSDNPSTMSTVR